MAKERQDTKIKNISPTPTKTKTMPKKQGGKKGK